MTGSVPGAQLRAFIERIERLEEEKATIADDIKEVFAEAKGTGFDVPTMRTIIRLRKKDAAERDEAQAMLDLYMSALGMLPLFENEAVPSYSQSGLTYADEKGTGAPHVQPVPTLTVAVASAAQDDVGATASSAYSPETANEVPAQDGGGTALDASHGDKSNAARPASVDAHVNGGRLAGEASVEAVTVVGDESGTLTNSHSPDTLPVEANSAGGAPSSSPASPALHSDDIDLTIPAFLKRDEGRGYPKRESVEA